MARTKPGAERRSDLLDAAEAVVLSVGVDALKIDDVTAGAGVAKGTFYLHFPSKGDLIGALQERYGERFVAVQRRAALDAGDGDRVAAWMRAGIEEYLRDVRLHDVLFHHGPRPEHGAPNAAVDALSELLDETGADVPDPTATAVVLYSVMHGTADHILHAPAERERMLAEVARLCRAFVPPRAA